MKYIFLYVYIFFIKIMDAFKPLITKYIFAYESNYIIKSISGLLENCNKQMNYKIDLSNEDHCGPCGQYILEKVKNKNKK